MNILYLHGFLGKYDPDSQKVQALEAIGEASGVDIAYSVTVGEIKSLIYNAILDNDIDLLIGISMGGYYSVLLGSKFGIPFVAINPATNPKDCKFSHFFEHSFYPPKKEEKTMVELTALYPEVDERFNFMRGLVRVSRADSVITPEEEGFFNNAATGLGLLDEQTAELRSALYNHELVLDVSLNNKEQSLFLIKEAIQLCYVDGNYSDLERAEVEKLSSELSVPTEDINALEAWVLEGVEWSKRGSSLLKELGGID